MLQEATGRKCGYLAGLWEPLLKSQLLWYSFSSRRDRSRPLEYRAPSWSWASMNGRVAMSGSHWVDWKDELESDLHYFITIKDAGVTLVADGNEYLQLKHGYIGLNCWLFRVSCYDESHYKMPEMELELAWDLDPLKRTGHQVYFMPVVINHRGPEHMARALGVLLVKHTPSKKNKNMNIFERCSTGTLITKTTLKTPETCVEVISCLEEAAKRTWGHDVLATSEFDGDFPDPSQEVWDPTSPTGRTRWGKIKHDLPQADYIKNFWYRQVITIV